MYPLFDLSSLHDPFIVILGPTLALFSWLLLRLHGELACHF
jgi:hypothetical protein